MSNIGVFILKKELNKKEIENALSDFFFDQGFYKISEINLTGIDSNEDSDVSYTRIPLRGDFCMQLEVFLRVLLDEEKLAYYISKRYNTDVVIDDGSHNPYSWCLIKPDGSKGIVFQSTKEMEEDVFVIEHNVT